MPAFTRREFVKNAALAAAATHLVASLRGADSPAPAAPSASLANPLPADLAELRWLEGKTPAALPGTTWGVPWPRGKHAKGTAFTLRAGGQPVPLQSWPLAYWPDGSLKWTGHALPAPNLIGPMALNMFMAPGTTPRAAAPARRPQRLARIARWCSWAIPASAERASASA